MGGILVAIVQLRSPLLKAAIKLFDRLDFLLKNLEVLEYKLSYANFYLEKSDLFQAFSVSLFTRKHLCV